MCAWGWDFVWAKHQMFGLLWIQPCWSAVTCWAIKYISEGVPRHGFVREKRRERPSPWAAFSSQGRAISALPGAIPGTVIMLLCIKGEVCSYVTWCLGRWDVLSWEKVTYRLAVLTQLLLHTHFPCSVVTVTCQYSPEATAVCSAFVAFRSGSGWSNRANASGTDSSDLRL